MRADMLRGVNDALLECYAEHRRDGVDGEQP
jgi:hypothetical protein